MNAAFESFLAGAPFLFSHFAVTIAMLGIGVVIYMWMTPHDERTLIRNGNMAAAISLGAAILGLALPLAICMAYSASVWDIVIWGVVTLAIQIVTFKIIDLWVRNLSQRIENGEIGTATLLAAIKVSVAAVNAAAVSG